MAILAFLPTLTFGWVYYDDFLMASEFHFYSRLASIIDVFRGYGGIATSGAAYLYYRPISSLFCILTSWVSLILTGQATPMVYHAANILFHALNCILLYEVLQLLATGPLLALAACLVFAVAPLTISTVSWIPGQNELLLTSLALGFLYVLLRTAPLRKKGESWRYFVPQIFFLALALLTKENALGLLLVGFLSLRTLKGNKTVPKKIWPMVIFSWVVVLACVGVMRWLTVGQGPGPGLSLFELARSLGQGLLFLPIYLGKSLMPLNLAVLPTPLDSLRWPGILALGLLLMALFKTKKRRWPQIVLGITWFIVFLLPTLIQKGEKFDTMILREDRGYLASIGVLLLVLEVEIVKRFNWKNLSELLVFLVLLVGFFGGALHYSRVYRDGNSFYLSAVESSPQLAFAHTHLGDMFLFEKKYDLAEKAYLRAMELNPQESKLHNNLGILYLRQGQLEKAQREVLLELNYYPADLLSWENLGIIHQKKGELNEAEKDWLHVVELDPRAASAWVSLARLYESVGNQEKAKAAAEKAQALGIVFSKPASPEQSKS